MAPPSALANISSEKLPTDYDRNPTVQDFELGVVDGATQRSFQGVAEGQLDATLLALFGILIKRYVREPEIEVGLVSSGSLSTAVPLHGVMGGEGSIAQAVEQVAALLQAVKPLEALPDNADLSSVAFSVATPGPVELPRDWAHVSYVNVDKRQLDLCLHVKPAKKDHSLLKFALRYNAKLLSKEMAEAMMRAWDTLVTNALADLSVGINHVGVVSEVDTQMLVQQWNQTDATFPPKQGIHELFEANADKAPQQVAVVGPSHDKSDEKVYELSYGDVEARANRLARYLAQHAGVVPGSIVGVLLERSTTFYVAMLAILKAGGAYVSIDPEYPDDRIEYMLQDSAAPALITTKVLGGRLQRLPGLTFVHVDEPAEAAAVEATSSERVSVPLDPERLCYVIYTSGSTGKPKGVQLSHANVLNLIRAEELIYQVKPEDRVLQGFSTSFDASVEEIWMAFHNGATLVVGTKEIMRSGPDFPRLLEQYGVTCLSTVPTLLSTVEEDFKNVRIIITGGEACSKELVNRWAATPGRRFFNTYGPTEATVIATFKECVPGNERMSIGKPLPNYQCYILDDHMQLLPPGAIGELVIGGVSVSRRGYLNLPEKTASVFKPDTLTNGPFPLYKSGDLARFSPAGNIEYYGRADSQVKIRGYRVELSEIESVMCEYPGVKSAVVDVQAAGGVKHLVAFVIPSDGEALDTAAMVASMKDKLPVFMIPSHVEKLAEFPTLPSGKVERRRLPRVMEQLAAAKANSGSSGPNEAVTRMRPMARKVALAFDHILGAGSVESEASHFFNMGGNSLMVSKLVTELRKEFPGVTSKDIYSNPTVEALALVLDKLSPVQAAEREVYVPPRSDTIKADVFQTLSMYPMAAYMGLNSITIWILFFTFKTWPAKHLIPFLAAVSLAITFGALFIVVAAKWLILGPVKEGDYPLWGSYHMRFWFVQSLDDLFRAYYSWLLAGTPVVNLYYRLLGSKVGSGVHLMGTLEGHELIELGDNVTLNLETVVSAMSIEDNVMRLRKVTIGSNVTVGVRSAIQPGSTVGSDVKIEAMTLVDTGSFVPSRERWAGSPAVKVGDVTPGSTDSNHGVGPWIGGLQLFWVVFWKAATALYLLPFLYIIRSVEVLNIYDLLYGSAPEPDWSHVPLNLGRMVGLFMILQIGLFFVSTAIVAGFKRLMLLGMNDVKCYPLDSMYYFRRWAADNMMNSLAGYTKQLRGSIYLPMWYRVMGAEMGTHAEISSYVNVCPEKLSLGDHVFVADDVIVGPVHVEDGIVTHERVRIGNRAFVGNASVVRHGTRIPDQTLVGVQSLAPKSAEPKETYVGSPPFKIKREGKAVGSDSAAEAATYNPLLHMLIGRYIVEALGFLLLHGCLALAFSVLYLCVTFSYLYLHDGVYAALLPGFVILHAVISGALTLFFKWLIIGRFKEGTYPLYGTYVWRTELVERLEENVAMLSLYPMITGTIWLSWWFQAMGCKIGKRAYLDHPCFCEPDLITIGDYVNIERTGTIQAHLFQDRVRTTGPVRIGNFCSIGSSAVVLIGGAMGDKATLSSLSMVMRSEELPPNSKWHGLPAKPHEEADLEAGAKAAAHHAEAGHITPRSGGSEELKEEPRPKSAKAAPPGSSSSSKYQVTVTVVDGKGEDPAKGVWGVRPGTAPVSAS